jgi:hypothetical protein
VVKNPVICIFVVDKMDMEKMLEEYRQAQRIRIISKLAKKNNGSICAIQKCSGPKGLRPALPRSDQGDQKRKSTRSRSYCVFIITLMSFISL